MSHRTNRMQPRARKRPLPPNDSPWIYKPHLCLSKDELESCEWLLAMDWDGKNGYMYDITDYANGQWLAPHGVEIANRMVWWGRKLV